MPKVDYLNIMILMLKKQNLSIFNMPIYKAILKYGHSNFIFEVVEFCEPGDAVQREQHYLDQFDFDYNVLENANSLLGFKHSAETLAKMQGRQNALGFNHSSPIVVNKIYFKIYFKIYRSSGVETLEKLRDAQTGKTHTPEALDKMREQWANRKLDIIPSVEDNNILLNSRKKIKGTLVVVKNVETNLLTEYLSISEAAKALNVTHHVYNCTQDGNYFTNLYKK
jgi:group I intron endonuclease